MNELKSVGSNQAEQIGYNGVTVLISYTTPVAALVGTTALCSRDFFSVTTSKHINAAVRRWNAKNRVNVDQREISNLLVEATV